MCHINVSEQWIVTLSSGLLEKQVLQNEVSTLAWRIPGACAVLCQGDAMQRTTLRRCDDLRDCPELVSSCELHSAVSSASLWIIPFPFQSG